MPGAAPPVEEVRRGAAALPLRLARPRGNRALAVGGLIVGGWVLIAAAAPLIAPRDPLALDVMNRLQAPSWRWPLGTDEVGRDILSRVLHGARITLPVAIGVIGLAALLGSAVGAVAGYAGGRLDEVLMRVVDVVLAFPSIVLAMAITAALGPGLQHAMLAILLVSWPEFSRLMRGQVLSVKANEYVTAARCLGVPWPRVLLRHVLPNAFPPTVVKATLDVGNAIILAGALSFIGLGAVPPTPEWGAMIAAGQAKFEYWWVATFPGLAILSVVLGFNFLGDGLQDLLNPRLRRE